jgi:hypothetical protein
MSSCAATNKDGSPCSNDAMADSTYCHVHQDAAGTDTKARSDPDHGFWTMLAGAFVVIFLTYFLVRLALGL